MTGIHRDPVEAIEGETIEPSQVELDDDEKVILGTDGDFSVIYDSAADRLEVRDEPSDTAVAQFRKSGANVSLDILNGNLDLHTNRLNRLGLSTMISQDVRNISSPAEGFVAYHDGSGTNTEGPAFHDGTGWVSTVDGTSIT